MTLSTERDTTGGRVEDPDSARLEKEKLRLETAKLAFEMEALRESKQLELDKLRYDVAEAENAPRRATISSVATILLGLATLLLGIAGFTLNATIGGAADRQRDSDYFSKLTDQFAKPGTSRVGAIVGFRTFLGPQSDRAPQTATLLANDLVSETDPLAVDAVVFALGHADMRAFEQVRAVNDDARRSLTQTAFVYVGDVMATAYRARNAPKATSWPDFVRNYAVQTAGSVDADLTEYAAKAPNRRDPTGADDAAFAKIQDMLQADRENDPFDVIALRQPAANPSPRHDLEQYARETKALIATSIILGTLLHERPMPGQPPLLPTPPPPEGAGDPLNGSGIAVFGANLLDANLSKMDLSGSYIDGTADGADFSLTNLSHAVLIASVGPSASRITTFCGSNLTAANLASVDDVVHNDQRLPDFTASNWWDAAVLSTEARAAIEAAYPRHQQISLFAKPVEVRRSVCAERPRRV